MVKSVLLFLLIITVGTPGFAGSTCISAFKTFGLQNDSHTPEYVKVSDGYKRVESTLKSLLSKKNVLHAKGISLGFKFGPKNILHKKIYSHSVTLQRFLRDSTVAEALKDEIMASLEKQRDQIYEQLIASSHEPIKIVTLHPLEYAPGRFFQNKSLFFVDSNYKILYSMLNVVVNQETLTIGLTLPTFALNGKEFAPKNFRLPGIDLSGNSIPFQTPSRREHTKQVQAAKERRRKQYKDDLFESRKLENQKKLKLLITKYKELGLITDSDIIPQLVSSPRLSKSQSLDTIISEYGEVSSGIPYHHRHQMTDAELDIVNTKFTNEKEKLRQEKLNQSIALIAILRKEMGQIEGFSVERVDFYVKALYSIAKLESPHQAEIISFIRLYTTWRVALLNGEPNSELLNKVYSYLDGWFIGKFNKIEKSRKPIEIQTHSDLRRSNKIDLSNIQTMKNLEQDFDVLARKVREPDLLLGQTPTDRKDWAFFEVDTAFLEEMRGIPDAFIGIRPNGSLDYEYTSNQKVYAVGHEGALKFHGFLSDNSSTPAKGKGSNRQQRARKNIWYENAQIRFYGVVFQKGFLKEFGAENQKATLVVSNKDFLSGKKINEDKRKVFQINFEFATQHLGQVHLNLNWENMIIDGIHTSHVDFFREWALAIVEFDVDGNILRTKTFDDL
ncbi:MAG: hypothetical protein KDD50_00005 [Bdellovibrionales bacterium]|nr:hypothetical protein [Bdellovibrionales bacterium]